jgi:hypothetical protein
MIVRLETVRLEAAVLLHPIVEIVHRQRVQFLARLIATMFLALVSVHLSAVALVAAHPPKSVVERFQFAVKVVYATMFVMRATFGIQLR